jgi:iron complex transport system permease protein
MINELELKRNGRVAVKMAENVKKEHQGGRVILILVFVLIITFLISCAIGRYPIWLPDLVKIFLSKIFGLKTTWPETLETVLFSVRLPRICAAIMVGGSLALAGGAYQGLFKNPMVSPDILGASAGAGFGAALAILWSFNMVEILVIPHFSRMIVGPNYKTLLPVSLLIGSIFLLIVDDVARSAFTMEIPLGILTSIIGAPFFVYLLMKGKRGWA